MESRYEKMIVYAAMAACGLYVVYLCLFRPAYLSNSSQLRLLAFVELVIAALWRFRQRFFLLLMFSFLLSGTAVPAQEAWVSGRWFVLIVGAVVGFVVYLSSRDHHFGVFHFMALLCACSALVSAVVSSYPQMAQFKALSLVLLFVYGASGARLMVVGQKERFFPRLTIVVDVLVYFTATMYFLLHSPFFGNLNSLGAVTGVVFVPLALWGALTADRAGLRVRRSVTLILSLLLLFFSQSRASILGALFACGLLCLSLRRIRLLGGGLAVAMILASFVAMLTPLQSGREDMPVRRGDRLLSSYLYKEGGREGVLGSRRSVWDKTAAVIRDNPWFGTGYGTSRNSYDDLQTGTYATSSLTSREHGSSYLAIFEWVGLLGVLPFAALVLLTLSYAGKVFIWLARTRNPRDFCVPVAMVLAAGLVNAAFEDWLFAVGYYLCVFFWVFAFALADLRPSPVPRDGRLYSFELPQQGFLPQPGIKIPSPV